MKMPYFQYPAWVYEIIQAEAEREIAELKIKRYCEIANITREEYEQEQLYLHIFGTLPKRD